MVKSTRFKTFNVVILDYETSLHNNFPFLKTTISWKYFSRFFVLKCQLILILQQQLYLLCLMSNGIAFINLILFIFRFKFLYNCRNKRIGLGLSNFVWQFEFNLEFFCFLSQQTNDYWAIMHPKKSELYLK